MNRYLTDSILFQELPTLLFIEINLSFEKNCSNSHNAPLGGITNWYRSQYKPLGYPGFVGRCSLVFSGPMSLHSVDTFNLCKGSSYEPCWNTGSGNIGFNSHYDLTLFLDDFTGIKENPDFQKNLDGIYNL